MKNKKENKTNNFFRETIRLHAENRGKIMIASKVSLRNRHDLSLAYTPGVGQISLEIARDKSLVRAYTMKRNSVAVVTDGSSVLGLGNLGPEAAIPVMEGKAVLFKEFAGIDAFPICLGTQDPEEIIKTVIYLAPEFGGINLEDIAAPKCFEIERRLIKYLDIPVMHDDQRGTATVVLAALSNALKVRKSGKGVRIVINGAGAAGTAIANLLLLCGFSDLVVCDSRGILHSKRENLSEEKLSLIQRTNQNNIQGLLSDALKNADVFIGVSKGDLVTQDMVLSMNARPIVFALANPIPEIMPDDARIAGAFIVATGRSDFPNQINNVLAFPGIFRGALDNNVTKITDQMLIKAAENLASHITKPTPELIIPDVFDKAVVSLVAGAIR